MASNEDEAPKIIVDSDWKSQAQAEKAKLAEAEAASAAGPGGDPNQLPPADFRTLVGMLATQAVMYMGGMVHPETGHPVVDLEYSKHSIDLLGTLEEKTRGNLSSEEAEELTGALQELRMRWVEISRLVAAQIQKQQSGAGGGTTGPVVS
ncbi:MAG: DUF1844 domain-containing protein [Phycisphaerales bacterium]|nr:DUF1844 domain-containing protein [Phycisphaerales bacterium]